MSEPWAPALSDVAAKIPHRTFDQTAVGADQPLSTFTANTVPTGEQVQPLIDAAVTVVRHAVSTVLPDLWDMAKDAAAWRAAADVELGWPVRDAEIREVYDRLNARATLALQQLVQAAEAANVGSDARQPYWSMPAAVPWGDEYL